MRKSFILVVNLFFILYGSSQQWSGTTNIYNTVLSGNVGIGTNAPARKLDVRGDIYTNSTVYIDGGDLFLSRTSQSFGYVVRPNTAGFRNLGFCAAGGATLDAISFMSINSTFSGSVGITGTCSIDVGDLYLSRVSNPYGYVIRPNTPGFKNLAFSVVGGGPLDNLLVNSAMAQFTGNVGIGTNNTGACKLAVEGKIGASEIKVTLTRPFPDFVFDKTYKLIPLEELEKYLNENGHLPNIPSAKQVEQNIGIELGDMSVKLLEKVEELTLYLIELDKASDKLKKENEKIREELKKLSKKK